MNSTNSRKAKLLNDGLIKFIREKFPDLDKNVIETVENFFRGNFFEDGEHSFKVHYLAHFIRAIESYIRHKVKNKLFRIVVKRLKTNDPLPVPGCALHIKGKSFLVYVHPNLEAKKQRVILAHELGHLLLCELRNRRYLGKQESTASLFGIIAILDKNNFYRNEAKNFIFDDFDIVSEFSQTKNRTKGKYGIS